MCKKIQQINVKNEGGTQMWILILIISITVNCIITLILISQIQKAVLNAVKIQDKHNEVFTRSISEIYIKLGGTKDE